MRESIDACSHVYMCVSCNVFAAKWAGKKWVFDTLWKFLMVFHLKRRPKNQMSEKNGRSFDIADWAESSSQQSRHAFAGKIITSNQDYVMADLIMVYPPSMPCHYAMWNIYICSLRWYFMHIKWWCRTCERDVQCIKAYVFSLHPKQLRVGTFCAG